MRGMTVSGSTTALDDRVYVPRDRDDGFGGRHAGGDLEVDGDRPEGLASRLQRKCAVADQALIVAGGLLALRMGQIGEEPGHKLPHNHTSHRAAINVGAAGRV